jgi:flagellar operon protein
MVINNRILSNIGRVQGTPATPLPQKPVQQPGAFGKILQQELRENTGLKFSKHAEMRLQARSIMLTDEQKVKIGQAVNKAEAKGVKDTLVLSDSIALVVNVKSRTVITAVSSSELKDNVFTNIDGAVFV